MQLVRAPTVDDCAEQGCPMRPDKLYRVSGAPWDFVQLGLCKMHSYGTKDIPASHVCVEISEDEWLVGEVMGS